MFSFLKKRDYRVTIHPDGRVLVVKGGEKLLTAALEAGLDWPHDCRVGSCGTCRCILKSGQIKPLTDFAYTLELDDLKAGAILACQSQLRSDVVVEVTLGALESGVIEKHQGRIGEIRHLTHDIQHLVVTIDAAAFADARAGQYAEISIEGLNEPRSYSFAVAPGAGEPGRISFFIRHVPGGEFTDWLFTQDRTGAVLALSGPYGSFYHRQTDGRMICIAGGSGLAPIHVLLEEGVRSGLRRDCVVLFGARTRADLFYLDELTAIGRAWSGSFKVLPVLSEEPAGGDWTGARGIVTDVLSEVMEVGGFGTGDQGYLCGPPPMVDAGIERLVVLGMREDAIFCDRFLDASTQPGGRAAM